MATPRPFEGLELRRILARRSEKFTIKIPLLLQKRAWIRFIQERAMNDFARTLASAQQGNPEAIEAIVAEFDKDVRFVCLQFQIEHVADISRADLLQESWVRIWYQMARFKIQERCNDARNQFRARICRVARNEIIHVLEKRQAQKRKPTQAVANIEDFQIADSEETPRGRVAHEEELRHLQLAVTEISADHRRAIEECFFRGKTVRQSQMITT